MKIKEFKNIEKIQKELETKKENSRKYNIYKKRLEKKQKKIMTNYYLNARCSENTKKVYQTLKEGYEIII